MLLMLLINLSHWQPNRSICPKSTLPQFSFPSQRSLKKSVQPHTPWQSKYLTVLGYPLGSDSGNRRHQTSARTWARHTSLLRIWNQGQEWDCDCWEVSQPLRYRYRVVSHRWPSPAWREWPCLGTIWFARVSFANFQPQILIGSFQIGIKTRRRSRPTSNRLISEPSPKNYPLC